MQCKCSLNNNYEVIGLCDIKKFNEKIWQLIDDSWTQIIIPEQVILPPNKPPIKTITKVYLNIKITSTKIIDTPSSDEESIEGLKLTGKILLVAGEICQNIIYISEGLSSLMHSVKFKNSFSTYIVIEEDADSQNDIYCVYPCIEDVSARSLDGRTISKNVTLFLFAHRAKGGPIKKLPNEIQFKNNTNLEIVKIEFEGRSKKITVEATAGRTANSTFTMTLYAFDATTKKKTSTINNNDAGTGFKDAFNDTDFLFGDLIKLEYQQKDKVVITNFPNVGQQYNPDHPKYEWFRIGKKGLQKAQPFLLTEFVFTKSNGDTLAIVQFNKITKKLAVTSTGQTADANPAILVSLQRYDGDAVSGSISNNVDATEFKRILDGASFDYDDIVLIRFARQNKNKVILMNYPNDRDVYPMIANDSQEFKITPTGIVENILTNVIILRNDSNNNEVVVFIKIQFDQVDKLKLLVDSTGKNAKAGTANYFKMTLNSKVSKIAGNSNANAFETAFNGEEILPNAIIKLEYEEANKVEITNFPTSSTPVYNPSGRTESFKVTLNGLVKVN